MTASKTPAPGTPPPSPPPTGPTHPTPTGPQRLGTGSPWPPRPGGPTAPGGPTGPGRVDDLMDVAAAAGVETPARPGPLETGSCKRKAGGPVKPDSEGGRAGDPPVPGAVSESFSLPSPPRFSVGTGPRYDALPRWAR